MKKIIVALTVLFFFLRAQAQEKFLTRTGHISFFSEAPLENIEAHNRQVTAIVDAGKGSLAFKVVMKSFEFEKAAMQDHFNKQYLHTDKYPEARFEGTLADPSALNVSKDGVYKVMVLGKLTIHGVTRDVKEAGVIEVKGNTLSTRAKFTIRLADYEVKVPSDYVRKISSEIDITVDATLNPFSR
jgi:polyisoprenoid-binding protein YceI